MKKLLLLTTAILFLSANPVFAHCGMCGVGEAKGSKGSMKENWAEEKVAKMTEELGLSEEQAAQILAAKKAKMEKKKAAKEEYMAKLKEILTEEQYEKNEAMWKEKHERKGSGHEHKGSGHEHKGSEKGSEKGS